jgi:hypothetical protein
MSALRGPYHEPHWQHLYRLAYIASVAALALVQMAFLVVWFVVLGFDSVIGLAGFVVSGACTSAALGAIGLIGSRP